MTCASANPRSRGTLPVEKAARDLPAGTHAVADASNSVFLGTAVQSGLGTAVIVRTGRTTAFGEIANRLAMRPPETEFARVSPEQKNRVILALKARGHVVGYLGDGINDAPSLHTADVGISVANGVEVAKDAAKVILLEKDLAVLNEGVIEGVSIPGDNVDPALLHRPMRWQIGFIRQFMMSIGPISSVYDFITFGILLWVFHASTNPALFRTGWFVESLATQTLVVFVIRASGNPFQSRPSRTLLLSACCWCRSSRPGSIADTRCSDVGRTEYETEILLLRGLR